MTDNGRLVTVVVAARRRVRTRLGASLRAAGFVIAAESGDLAGALAAVQRERPEICVVDRDLPGGGLAAVAALTTQRKRPAVVVVGGTSDAELRAARLAGAAACLPGEADAESLVDALAGLAGSHRK